MQQKCSYQLPGIVNPAYARLFFFFFPSFSWFSWVSRIPPRTLSPRPAAAVKRGAPGCPLPPSPRCCRSIAAALRAAQHGKFPLCPSPLPSPVGNLQRRSIPSSPAPDPRRPGPPPRSIQRLILAGALHKPYPRDGGK